MTYHNMSCMICHIIVAALGYVAYAEALQYVVIIIDIHQMIPLASYWIPYTVS